MQLRLYLPESIKKYNDNINQVKIWLTNLYWLRITCQVRVIKDLRYK